MRKTTSTKPTKISTETPPVSVIIASHNEENNLKKYLPVILEQEYPHFEVIVINDRSKDHTNAILEQFKTRYPHLKTTEIKDKGKLKHGKKLAITLGVKASQYEHLVLTDADCCPNSPLWLKEMAQAFAEQSIVLAYSPYFQSPNFLNKWIRYDTMTIALQYFSYAYKGFPYMGIGRNLAYKKDLFIDHGGLASHAHKRSGDDDLFVNAVASKANTAMTLSADSFVYSVPETSFKAWKKQKQRHLTTFTDYKPLHTYLLALEVGTRGLFYTLFLVLLFTPFWAWDLGLFALRMFFFYLSIALASEQFKEPKMLGYAPFFDISLPLVNLYLVIR